MGMVYPNSIIQTNGVPFVVRPKKSDLDARACQSHSLLITRLKNNITYIRRIASA